VMLGNVHETYDAFAFDLDVGAGAPPCHIPLELQGDDAACSPRLIAAAHAQARALQGDGVAFDLDRLRALGQIAVVRESGIGYRRRPAWRGCLADVGGRRRVDQSISLMNDGA